MRTWRAGGLALFLAAIGLLGAAPGALAWERGWDPARTWVFVVGTLQWKDSESFSAFPQKGRRDAELVEFFRKAGVPAGQIVYLQDRAATTQRIEASLKDLLARTRPGDLLFLYYCGHGYKDDHGASFFASYDADDKTSGWPMASIPAAIEAGFHGSRALLTADCCYSGALGREVKRQARRVGMACLTSSSASQLSTGNWTFTEALLDGLRGAPGCDADADGEVTLKELAKYIAADMAVGEEQLATFTATAGFDPDTVLADAGEKSDARVGQRVDVRYSGELWKARIVGARPGQFRVHWLGSTGYDDEWVAAGDVRFAAGAAATYQVGASVDVKWKGKWYAASVLERDGALYLIHYTGYDASWDEWVGPRRMRPTEAK
jgi:hypothetical protein